MRVSTRRLLGRLATLYPCVILSGRARPDLLSKLRGVPLARAIGNHGAESGKTDGKTRRRMDRWKAAINPQLGGMPGLWVEDKGLSLAVHYRHHPDKAEARRRILKAAERLDEVRIVGGKQVVNLVLNSAPNKGQALIAERERLGCALALYVGDDDNDEDAFASKGNIVPVRVGRKRESHARYYLRTQDEIDDLLKLLVTLRSSKDC
jgi:trehalose 6-phosphate phosphatase